MPDYPGYQVAIAHKTKMRECLGEFLLAMGIGEAEELAQGLMLLVDGAFVQRRLYGSHEVNLRQAAMMLLGDILQK